MNIIIPIGGVGQRFIDDGYDIPKALVKVLGEPLIIKNLESLDFAMSDNIFIVYRSELEKFDFVNVVKKHFHDYNIKFIKLSNYTRGAAESVLYALEEMGEATLRDTTVVVDSDNIYNENILITCKKIGGNIVFFTKDNTHTKPIYSYIKIEDTKVVEIKEKERISENICIGVYCFDSGLLLKETIKQVVKNDTYKDKEYYMSSLYKYLINNKITVLPSLVYDFYCLGTPGQLQSFATSGALHKKQRFCFDLDNTLVTSPTVPGDYSTAEPIDKTIEFVNNLYDSGHTIIIYTARRMRTHGGNVGAVQADIAKTTLETLDKFGIKYHEIYFGKPYANFYIDDLAINTSADLEKATGFYFSHAQPRKHNVVEMYDNYVVKKSCFLDGETYYYNNIPKHLKSLFPELLDSGENFIKIEKIKGTPLSFLNTSKLLNEEIINRILETLGVLHAHKPNTEENIYSNYYEKLVKRINSFDFSQYPKFETKIEDIFKFLLKYEKNNLGQAGMIHGDPVFTNIIMETDGKLKFIDMRGKLGQERSIYGDVFYDFAKVYQSIIGYDFVLAHKEIDDNFIDTNIKIFDLFINKNYGNARLLQIKELTKSLIVSLIPIHNNSRCPKFYKLLERC